jgi:hypothetical protein
MRTTGLVMALVTLAAGPRAQTPLALPDSLERQVPAIRMALGPSATIADAVDAVAREVALPPMGVEARPVALERRAVPADPRLQTRPAPPLSFTAGPGPLSRVLADLLRVFPGYEMWIDDGVIDIAPEGQRHNAAHFLNKPFGFYRVKDVSFHRAAAMLAQQLEPTVVVREWREADIGPVAPSEVEATTARAMARPVTLSVVDRSARDVMNRLVASHGEMIWTATYVDLRAEGAPPAVQQYCTLRFLPVSRLAISAAFPLASPVGQYRSAPDAPAVRPASATPAPSPPAVAPALRLMLNVPARPEDLVLVAGRIGAAARKTFGIEVVGSAQPPAPPPTGPRQAYDLSGLSIPDALNKIVEFMPAYAWSADGDVIHIRPTGAEAAHTHLLDTRVPKVAGRFESLQAALSAVIGLIQQRPPTMPPPGRFPPAGWSDETKRLVLRPTEVDLRDVTIRQVLDAIARSHGAMSWAVVYRGSPDRLQSLGVTFIGFEQWSLGSSATVAREAFAAGSVTGRASGPCPAGRPPGSS